MPLPGRLNSLSKDRQGLSEVNCGTQAVVAIGCVSGEGRCVGDAHEVLVENVSPYMHREADTSGAPHRWRHRLQQARRVGHLLSAVEDGLQAGLTRRG